MTRRRFLQTVTATAAFGVTAVGPAGAATPDSFSPETEQLNDSAAQSLSPIPLDGEWSFHPDEHGKEEPGWATVAAMPGKDGWTGATVPGCWEKDGIRATLTGPAWYRRNVEGVAAPGQGGRFWWECDAVSYSAEGFANGKMLGTHTGMWDAFAWEVPADAVASGQPLKLALRVEKPGGSRFPVRETLAGFLPYVWGTWGGPWQPMRLRYTGPCRIANVRGQGNSAGILDAEATVDLPPGVTATLQFVLRDADGLPVGQAQAEVTESGTVQASLGVSNPKLWETFAPTRYQLTVTALVGGVVSDVRDRRVGFRDVQVRDDLIYLNGKPIYFRAPLSWGWYEDQRAPNPSEATIRAELEAIRKLGFNGVKLCLWVPPPAYFDIADELGVLLWAELPLWLPQLTDANRKTLPDEYQRIVRQISDHPSVLLWTVGCEIGEGVDAGFLRTLYDTVKKETHSPLVRDNSGSAECYGGPLPESADYWDFHPYCDLAHARATFTTFAPQWRAHQPFLFGEFNDQDAFRDLPAITKDRKGKAPWWTVADPNTNPQGVRWEYGVTEQSKRMADAGIVGRAEELRESSRKQALLTRKYTLELARSLPFTSGYVITGLADTPISTAGIFDDLGQPRFTPEEFAPFNANTVLFLETDRRRAWVAGGDRPAYLDRFGAWSKETVRRHVGVSYFDRQAGPAKLTWEAARQGGGGTLAKGEASIREIKTGAVREAGLVEFDAPAVSRPVRVEISATLELPTGEKAVNTWPVWVYPKPGKESGLRVGLFDPANHLADFADATGLTPVPLLAETGAPTDRTGPTPVIVATAWRPTMREYVRAGGRLLLIQPGASAPLTGDGLPADAVPFWREAMRLFENHPSWGGLPHDRTTGLIFYGLASDAAFDREKLRDIWGEETVFEPVLTRVDARTYRLHAYTVAGRLGAGRFLLTTLRPQGGLGDKPSGLKRHPAGAYLLRQWVDWLASGPA